MNLPARKGDRYMCFILVREDKGWGGPYGQYRRPGAWECEDCGYRIPDYTVTFDGRLDPKPRYEMKRMADHHEHGHTPCPKCGQLLLRRMDGSPRQHAHNKCPGKSPGDKIEREFIKNMTAREYA